MAPDSPLEWTEDGQPRSRLFGDVYYSSQDGLAETRAVFLEGCSLPDAWAGQRRFVVAELGFGVGLNFLALAELWRRTRPSAGVLHVFSTEAHPVSAAEAARALERWPELSNLAGRLTADWPLAAKGFRRLEWPDLGVILDVAVADVTEALTAWSGCADAWFLDGFSPALNPAMWSDEVMALVGRRSAPGARAATYTVAGQVRRGLAAAGFETVKKPGFGRKRERLEARFPGVARRPTTARRVAIIGAGIAGAAAARAVRALGGEALVFEAEARGARASGNPAALVTPRLDAGGGPPAQLFAQAFGRAVQLYEGEPQALIGRGVLQLASGERDAKRFAQIVASGLFPSGAVEVLSAPAASDRLGEAAAEALHLASAVVVEPARVLEAWLGDVRRQAVGGLAQADGRWRVLGEVGSVLEEVDAVIVAAGMDSSALGPSPPMQPVRGQASWVETGLRPPAVAWGGYALPTRRGVLFGATHDRDDQGLDVRQADHRRNFESLAHRLPALAAQLDGLPIYGRAAIRATTADRLPIAGEGEGGSFLLTGFGSRGFSFAPLLAEHVAALALGAPSPLPAPLADLIAPDRFARRAARRSLPVTA